MACEPYAPVYDEPPPAGAAGASGGGGAGGAAGGGGVFDPPEVEFTAFEALPVDAEAVGARVRAVATAPKSDKALVVYEKQIEGGGSGLYAALFDGEAFGAPALLAEGGPASRMVWAEFLPVSEKAVVAFDRSNGFTLEVFASFFDGEAFRKARPVGPGPRPVDPTSPPDSPGDTYYGYSDSYGLVASRTVDAAALVMRWPSVAQVGGKLESHTWALPIGPEGLGPLARADVAPAGEAFRTDFERPKVAFLPSGRILFCDGGFAPSTGPDTPSEGVAWCLPYADGAFGEPLVVRGDASAGGATGTLVKEVQIVASGVDERALLLFGEYGFDDQLTPHQAYASFYEGGAFGDPLRVATGATSAQATFVGAREALVSYQRHDKSALTHTVNVALVGDGVDNPFVTSAESICLERSPRLQLSPAGGGLLAFGASRREGEQAGCDLRASWYDGEAFAELARLPERFVELELRPLPRSPRAVGAFKRYDEGAAAWRLFGTTISADGGGDEVALGRSRQGDSYSSYDGELRVFASHASDRALVVTPAPRRPGLENAGEIWHLAGDTEAALEASASLFDGTTFTPLARVGTCAHAAVLGGSGRFLLACDEGGITAKIVE
ncbi:MAG TPA: hypothetical protein VFS43_02480 [Polyangiaceae bacterium]|nr:hypothetical protein [Polyangiaceae bacterium]